MTRPLYEPSTARTEARLGFDRNQLQRRPRLQTAATLESGVAYDAVVDGTSSVNDNTLTTIAFDNVFASAGATAIAIDIPPAPATGSPLKLTAAGWFLIGMEFYWATLPGTAMYQIDPDTPFWTAPVLAGECTHLFSRNVNYQFGPVHNEDTSNSLILKVQHLAGGAVNITSVYMTVLYLGLDIDEAAWPLFP